LEDEFVRWYTIKEAADYLGLSVSFLNQMRLAGTGPQYRKGGVAGRFSRRNWRNRVWYSRAWCDQWLVERETAARYSAIHKATELLAREAAIQ
jgi:hypothetical protein